jgi:hemerythrin-like domain-containing protein
MEPIQRSQENTEILIRGTAALFQRFNDPAFYESGNTNLVSSKNVACEYLRQLKEKLETLEQEDDPTD